MCIVAIDTATEKNSLFLYKEDEVLAYANPQVGELLDALDALGFQPKDLSHVVVGIGPGSYTGIRVGVACAKALSLSLKIPLVGVSSLKPYRPPDMFQGTFLSVIDAKIGGVYAIKGKLEGSEVTYIGEDALWPFAQFIESLKEVSCLVTPNYSPLALRLKEAGVHSIPQVHESYPSQKAIMSEAKKLFESGRYSLDGTLTLSYLR